MEFKKIEFEEKQTQRVYDNYIKSIKHSTKRLTNKDRQEVLMEFNSHIYESIQSNNGEELENLLNAIDKLGAPEEVLKSLVADKLLEKATNTFNPIDVFRALLLNITNGISYIIFSILYLQLGGFIFLAIAKIFKGDKVGMFYKEDKFMLLGLRSAATGYEEVLGHWFIPIMLLSMVIIYILITLLLKFKKMINRKKA